MAAYRQLNMKLVARCFERGGSGYVVLIAEDTEDMWHAFNLIRAGDNVKTTTFRKVQNESTTGSSTSMRIRTTLKINVETIDLDTFAGVLRLKGKNIEENQYVKVRCPGGLSGWLTQIETTCRWAHTTRWTWN